MTFHKKKPAGGFDEMIVVRRRGEKKGEDLLLLLPLMFSSLLHLAAVDVTATCKDLSHKKNLSLVGVMTSSVRRSSLPLSS